MNPAGGTRRVTKTEAVLAYRRRVFANALLQDVLRQLEPVRFAAGEWENPDEIPPEMAAFLERRERARIVAQNVLPSPAR